MVSKVLILQLCFTLDLQLDRMVMETSYRRLEGVNFAEEAYSLYEGISVLEEWIRLELFRNGEPCARGGNTPARSKVSMNES